MPLPCGQQLFDALLAEGQAPVLGQVMRVVGRHDLLVGGRDPAARGVELAWRLVQRHPAHPVETRLPARRRHQALQFVVGPPQRHAARRHQGNASGTVGHHHALHGHRPLAAGGHELLHRPGLHEGQAHGHWVDVGVQRRPSHGQHQRGRCGALGGLQQVRRDAGVGDHRPVACVAQRHGHVGLAFHANAVAAHIEGGPALGRAVAGGVGRVDLLDVQVLHVGAGVGETPGQVGVLSQHHQGQAGQRGAGHAQAACAGVVVGSGLGALDLSLRLHLGWYHQARQVPQRGCAQLQVRVVGQQRRARAAAAAGQHPVVGAHALHARGRCDVGQAGPGGRQALGTAGGCGAGLRRLLGQPQAAEEAGVVGQRTFAAGDARPVARVRRQQFVDALDRHQQGQAQTQQFHVPVTAEVPAHHDGPGQAVHRVPGLGLHTQDQEFGRPRAQLRLQHRVHAIGISLQQRTRIGRQLRPLHLGCPAHTQVAQKAVGGQGAGAEHLRQPPGTDAALRFHLPQPVLCMGHAQTEGGVAQAAGVHRGNALRVALDAQRRRRARQHQFAPRHRQRALRVDAQGGRQPQHHHQQRRRAALEPLHAPPVLPCRALLSKAIG